MDIIDEDRVARVAQALTQDLDTFNYFFNRLQGSIAEEWKATNDDETRKREGLFFKQQALTELKATVLNLAPKAPTQPDTWK